MLTAQNKQKLDDRCSLPRKRAGTSDADDSARRPLDRHLDDTMLIYSRLRLATDWGYCTVCERGGGRGGTINVNEYNTNEKKGTRIITITTLKYWTSGFHTGGSDNPCKTVLLMLRSHHQNMITRICHCWLLL